MNRNESQNKRKRFTSIPIHVDESTGLTVNAKLDWEAQTISLLNKAGISMDLKKGISRCYKGDNKIKTEATIFSDKIPISDKSLLSQFEKIYSVDTNYKIINSAIYVAVGVLIEWIIVSDNDKIWISPFNLITDCFPNAFCDKCAIEYENYMWSNFLSIIRDEQSSNYTKKSLMIVDSNLGQLEAYNKHDMPFFKGAILPCANAVLTLPDNFTMYYAKADASSDSIINLMIKANDYVAKKLLFSIENNSFESCDNMELRKEILSYFQTLKTVAYTSIIEFMNNNKSSNNA